MPTNVQLTLVSGCQKLDNVIYNAIGGAAGRTMVAKASFAIMAAGMALAMVALIEEADIYQNDLIDGCHDTFDHIHPIY